MSWTYIFYQPKNFSYVLVVCVVDISSTMHAYLPANDIDGAVQFGAMLGTKECAMNNIM